MKKKSLASRLVSVIALTSVSALALAGCSTGKEPAATETRPAHVTIDFWTWAAGMDVLVDEFNRTHDDVTVKLGAISSDNAYQKLAAAAETDTAPDIAQIEFQQLPTFATDGHLLDITEIAKPFEDQYQPSAWSQSGFLDHQYAIPNDTGPLVMYYNSALFEKAGIAVPQTWDEFQSSAVTLKEKTGASMGSLIATGGFLSAISAQASAHWFGIDGDSWQVTINDDGTKTALNYWTKLAADGYAVLDPGFNSGYWQKLDSEQIATYIVGAWGYRGMKGNLNDTAGDWRAAPVPQWDVSNPTNAYFGGSSWAVMKGAEYPDAAVEFATWLSSDPTAMNLQYANSGYYPAAADVSTVTGYSEADPFFGGQEVASVFADAAEQVDTSWQWGPMMINLYDDFSDRIPTAVSSGSADKTLDGIQNDFVRQMKSRGLSVVES